MNTAAVRCPIATEAAAMRRRDALAQMNRGSQPLLAGDAMDYVVLASPHATEDTTHARTRSSIVAPSCVADGLSCVTRYSRYPDTKEDFPY